MSKMFFTKGKLLPVSCYFLSLCVLILHGKTLSVEELKETCGFKINSTSINSTRNLSMSPLTGTRFMACDSVSCLPSSYTWLDHKDRCPSLGQITNQLRCGSCWAVAAAAVISDRHCLQTNEQRTFSAKHIAGCTMKDGGCSGGDPKDAMEYYVKQGVVTGGDPNINEPGCVPYAIEKNRHLSCETTCESDYSVPFELDKRRGLSSYTITSRNVNEIKLDLMRFGPLVATMEIFDDFRHYKNGTYKHSLGSKSVGNHAVRLVGWGEENGVSYWICANSYGEKWGEMDGFFRILAGQNECQIENYLVGVETEYKSVSIPMETSEAPTIKSNVMPINIPTTPISSSNPLALCETSGNTTISGALIRYNTGNVIGNFNTICIHDPPEWEYHSSTAITGSNNIICFYINGKTFDLMNQHCNERSPMFSQFFNCDNMGYGACAACRVHSNFKHCPKLSFSARMSNFLKSIPDKPQVACKGSYDAVESIIKINDGELAIGQKNLICRNTGSVHGLDNVICRNDGTTWKWANEVCVTGNNTYTQSFKCQAVEKFCQTCDSHLMFKDC